jgi:hypothetical protein
MLTKKERQIISTIIYIIMDYKFKVPRSIIYNLLNIIIKQTILITLLTYISIYHHYN